MIYLVWTLKLTVLLLPIIGIVLWEQALVIMKKYWLRDK